MSTAALDPDLDLGGRLSFDDQMSVALTRLNTTWSRTETAFAAGVGGIVVATNRMEAAFQRSMGWMQRAIVDQNGRMRAMSGQFTTNVFEGALGAAQRGMFNLAASLGGEGGRGGIVGRSLSSLSNGARVLTTSLGALAGQSSVTGMLLGGPAGIAMLLHNVAAGAILAGSEIENLRIAFTTLAHGDVQMAQDHLDELQRFAVGKPFEFSFLTTASRNLQTYGFAMRDVTGLLQDFGDAAFTAGTGSAGVDTMVRVFGQINTLGRMTRGHISQLVGAGVNAVPILREQLHLTDAQIQNIARSGVPAARIIEALRRGMREQFAGGLARTAGTLGAKLSDLADVMGLMRRAIYGAMGPAIIPYIDSFSGFLVRNAERIARTFSTVFLTIVRLIVAVLAPAFYALSDAFAATERGARTSLGSVIGTLQRVALVVEAVSALIVGDNGRGITSISVALHDRLVRAGLWHTAVEIARFANRARAFLGGVVEEIGRRIATGARVVAWLGRAFGITGGAMLGSRERAAQLGVGVVRLVAAFLLFRRALALGGMLLSLGPTLQTIAGGVTRVFGALATGMRLLLAGNPVVLAVTALVVVLGALAWYVAHNAEAMAWLRASWASARAALAPLGELVSQAWDAFKGMASDVGSGLVTALRQAAAAFSPLLAPLRIVASFVAVALYLNFVLALGVLRAMGAVAARVFGFLARGIGTVLGWVLPLLMANQRFAVGVLGAIGRVASSLLVVAGPALAWVAQKMGGVIAVGRAFGMVLLYVVGGAALGLFRLFAWAFGGIARAMRAAFDFIVPYVGPIFTTLASVVSAAFGHLADAILWPLRFIARQLVTVYRGLPAALQPAALREAVDTLSTFGAGGVVGAPEGGADPNAGARGQINASRAAPARAAAAATSAAAAATSVATQAPVVNVQAPPPSPVVIQVDGRELARTVDAHREDEDRRRGAVVATTRVR